MAERSDFRSIAGRRALRVMEALRLLGQSAKGRPATTEELDRVEQVVREAVEDCFRKLRSGSGRAADFPW